MIMQKLGRFLREARIDSDLSQKEVAKKLGYASPQFVSNWERGIASPPMHCLPKICRMYGVSKRQAKKVMLQDFITEINGLAWQ